MNPRGCSRNICGPNQSHTTSCTAAKEGMIGRTRTHRIRLLKQKDAGTRYSNEPSVRDTVKTKAIKEEQILPQVRTSCSSFLVQLVVGKGIEASFLIHSRGLYLATIHMGRDLLSHIIRPMIV